MCRIKAGDTVSFLNEVGGGKVVQVLNERYAILETQDGMEVKYLLSELVIRNTDESYNLEGFESYGLKNHTTDTTKKKLIQKKTDAQVDLFVVSGEVTEVDLHIEELVNSHRHMTNGEIVTIQLNHFHRGLMAAIQNHSKKLIIIHGIGEGVLRREIRRELKEDYPQYDFHDASYQKYGYGATEVILR